MNQKAYKTRVEISVVVEIDVAAASEDDAGFEAEETADQLVAEIVSNAEYGGDGMFVPCWGVRCTEVTETEEE